MLKITLVGAGSHVFSRRLIADILTWPSLQDATISLMDVAEDRLSLMAALARKMVKQLGTRAKIEASTDLQAALDGADYVTVSIKASASRKHITIPFKHGINHAIGDTMGPCGVFYFLKNAPALIEIVRAMEQVCPNALMLNYTNPMVMLSWAVSRLSAIRYVGLCHSVQGTAKHMAEYINMPFERVSYWAAGINHMAWFLKFYAQGEDGYPLLWKAMKDPDIYERDIVNWEVLKHFGAFVSESSIHFSEYVPYFRRTPALIDQHTSEKMWGNMRKGQISEDRWASVLARRAKEEKEHRRLARSDDAITIERSQEYCARIMNAIETNVPYVFNGNVPNSGLITNLLQRSVVEVPIMVDGCGLHPCYVGDLPPALAGLNRTSLNVQELAVRGFIEGNREYINQAIQLDPLTASLLSLSEIRGMVDEMFEADQDAISI